MKRVLQIAVALLLTALLLYFVVDVREVVRIFRQIDLTWALLTIGLITIDRGLMSYKWGLLLRVRGHRIPFSRGMMVYCSAMVWGLALPSTVGADTIRALLMKRHGVDLIDSVATIMVERAVGFLVALAMGLVSLLLVEILLPEPPMYELALSILGAAMLFGLLAVAVSFSERAFAAMCRLVPRRWRGHAVLRKLESLHEAYRSLGADRRTFVTFSALTVLQQVLTIVVISFIALSLDLDVKPLYVLAAAPLAFLFARLPISVDGIGVYEAIFVATMSLWGVSPSQAFAISLCGRFYHLSVWLPWFVAYALRSHRWQPDLVQQAGVQPSAVPE